MCKQSSLIHQCTEEFYTIRNFCKQISSRSLYFLTFSSYSFQTLPGLVSVRHSSFKSSEPLTPELQDRMNQRNIEVLKSPPEWKYVERLLGERIIAPAPVGDKYLPSGWKPQKDVTELKERYPYFVNRSRNHQIPVYLLATFRGQRKITKLKRIEGDIWALEKDLKNMLEKTLKKRVETRVNEVSGQIDFKGIHVDMITNHLLEQGF